MENIAGKYVSLCPAGLVDRRMIYHWSHDSDIAPLLHLSGEAEQSFEEFCAGWGEAVFSGEASRAGRMFLILWEETPVGVIICNEIDAKNRAELDIWLRSEADCGKGLGSDAVQTLCKYLHHALGVTTFMMQPSARNPRAIRAYEKAGFARRSATAEDIAAEWGGVDHHDSILMIRNIKGSTDADA